MKWEIPKTKSLHSGQNVYRTGRHLSCPGAGQADQQGSPCSEAQDTGRCLFGGYKE